MMPPHIIQTNLGLLVLRSCSCSDHVCIPLENQPTLSRLYCTVHTDNCDDRHLFRLELHKQITGNFAMHLSRKLEKFIFNLRQFGPQDWRHQYRTLLDLLLCCFMLYTLRCCCSRLLRVNILDPAPSASHLCSLSLLWHLMADDESFSAYFDRRLPLASGFEVRMPNIKISSHRSSVWTVPFTPSFAISKSMYLIFKLAFGTNVSIVWCIKQRFYAADFLV